MSGSSKRRNSKWEHIDSEAFPENFYDRAPPRRPREPLSPIRGSRRHDSRSKESTMVWDREDNCPRMSPDLDERKPRHLSRSPRNGWGRSHRISKSRSRSRSRSPLQNFRRESGVSDRSRSRSGGTAQICRDFASGRCRRGNSCHFLHQDALVYDNRRAECSPPDDWEGRHRRTGSSRYSPDDTKDNAIRTEKSPRICNDFLKGRCRRADCRFSHHDTAADVFEKGPVEDVYRSRDHESRSRGSYPDVDHRSRDSRGSYHDLDRRRRDTYPDRNHEFEPPKRIETPCKFFAAGNCRNGTRCRFSHQVQESFSPDNHDRRSLDDRRGPDHKFESSQGWDGPRWGDVVTTVSTIPDMQCWGEEKIENEEVNTARTMGDGKSSVSVIPDVKGWGEDKIENKEMSSFRNQSDGRAQNHKYESDRVWHGPSWSDTNMSPNVPVHDWEDSKNETTEMAEGTRARPGDDSWSHNMLDINQTWDPPDTTDNTQSTQDSQQPLQWKTETIAPVMGLSDSTGRENFSGDMEISPGVIKQQVVNFSNLQAPLSNLQAPPSNLQAPAAPPSNLQAPPSNLQAPPISNIVFPVIQQDTPGEVSYEKHYQAGFQGPKLFTEPFAGQNLNDRGDKPISYPGEKGIGDHGGSIVQNQPMHFSQGQGIFQPSQGVNVQSISNINPSGHSQMSFPSHFSQGETLQLSLNPTSFQDNKVVDGSHTVSLTSSALAPGSVPATTPGTVSSVQLAQLSHLTASLTQLLENRQQLSHFSSAVTSQSVSNLPDLTAPAPLVSASVIPPNEPPAVLKQYDSVVNSTEPKIPNLDNYPLSSVEQRSSYNEMHQEGSNANRPESLASIKDEENGEKAAEAKIKVPENGPSQDMGHEDGADDGKKLKDMKGIRPFKFALAEFVKELLKPAWKDGQVGKEAYKTIVKKVVDKVVETLGPQIPQTKEKIDLYLSSAKPKLEKLVQAYVGKHQKS